MSIEELRKKEKDLSEIYIRISNAYKRMSKTKDNYSQNIIQGGIDGDLKRANELREVIDAAKKDMMAQWAYSIKQGASKSKYD